MPRITVLVKPGSKAPQVLQLSSGELKVSVRQRATEGEANLAVIEAVAEHFGLSQSKVSIVFGHTGRKKVLDIQGI